MVRTQQGSDLYVCTKFEADCSIRAKVIRGSQNFENWVTWPWPRPLRGYFVVRTQERSVLYMHTKFEADRSIRSKVIRRVKVFATPQPFQGAREGQKLISWRWSLPSPTNPVWWKSMHAISSYRGNRPTHTQPNPQTGPITIHCAAKLSAQCNAIQQSNFPSCIRSTIGPISFQSCV